MQIAEEKENHFSFNIMIILFYYFTAMNIFSAGVNMI